MHVYVFCFCFFYKQKTAYEMRISDWSSDVCSSDLMAALCALPPTVEPRATQHIFQMVAMIEALIDKGLAYAADGHVLFSVPSMADYGEIGRASCRERVCQYV